VAGRNKSERSAGCRGCGQAGGSPDIHPPSRNRSARLCGCRAPFPLPGAFDDVVVGYVHGAYIGAFFDGVGLPEIFP